MSHIALKVALLLLFSALLVENAEATICTANDQAAFQACLSAGSDTIYLLADAPYTLQSSIVWAVPTVPLRIFGQGHTIDLGQFRFDVTDSAIELENVSIHNGLASGFHGGAIQGFRSNLTLNNVRIYNSFTDSAGGAIFGDNCEVYLKDVIIEGCVANNGGGIYLTTGQSKIYWENVTFRNNTITNLVSSDGAAAYLDFTASTSAIFNGDINFDSNTGLSGSLLLALRTPAAAAREVIITGNATLYFKNGIRPTGFTDEEVRVRAGMLYVYQEANTALDWQLDNMYFQDSELSGILALHKQHSQMRIICKHKLEISNMGIYGMFALNAGRSKIVAETFSIIDCQSAMELINYPCTESAPVFTVIRGNSFNILRNHNGVWINNTCESVTSPVLLEAVDMLFEQNSNVSLLLLNGGTEINSNHSIKFSKNLGEHGGALRLSGDPNKAPTLIRSDDILFQTNVASSSGGAVYFGFGAHNTFQSPSLRFIDNSSPTGGAVYVAGAPSQVLFNGSTVTLERNTAKQGCSIYTESGCPTFDATFEGNLFAPDHSLTDCFVMDACAVGTCTTPQPGPQFVCVNGLWTLFKNFEANGTITIDIPLQINGNFTIPVGTAVIITGSSLGDGSLVNISGCAALDGELVLDFTAQDLDSLDGRRLALLESSCSANPSSVIAKGLSSDTCKKYSIESEQEEVAPGRFALSSLFKVDTKGCGRKFKWWIPLVAVIGGIVLIAAILAILFTHVDCLRLKARPYSDRSKVPR